MGNDSPLYRNAIDAIQVGVEDFGSESQARVSSAVRNLTSGLLLLCKEKLRRLSSEDEILIWKTLKPSCGDDGRVVFQKVGKSTVDVAEIKERFKAFGVSCDVERLQRIVDVRNSVEHHYLDDAAQVRGAFVDGLRFLTRFMPEYLGLDPSQELDPDVWESLLEQEGIHAALSDECRATYKGMEWPPVLQEALEEVGCPECKSTLIRQADASNTNPFAASWVCAAFGNADEASVWVGKILTEFYSADSFIAAKEDAPDLLDTCPECGEVGFVYAEAMCLACGFKWDGGECAICGGDIELEDRGEALCAYHRYVAERERDR